MSLNAATLAAIGQAVAAALAATQGGKGTQPAAPVTGRRPDGRRKPRTAITPADDTLLGRKVETDAALTRKNKAEKRRRTASLVTTSVDLHDLPRHDSTTRKVEVVNGKGEMELKTLNLQDDTREYLATALPELAPQLTFTCDDVPGATGPVSIVFNLIVNKAGSLQYVAKDVGVAVSGREDENDPMTTWGVKAGGKATVYLPVNSFYRR